MWNQLYKIFLNLHPDEKNFSSWHFTEKFKQMVVWRCWVSTVGRKFKWHSGVFLKYFFLCCTSCLEFCIVPKESNFQILSLFFVPFEYLRPDSMSFPNWASICVTILQCITMSSIALTFYSFKILMSIHCVTVLSILYLLIVQITK